MKKKDSFLVEILKGDKMKTLSKILETLEKIKTDIRFLSEASHSRYLDVSKNLSEYKAIIEQQDRILQAIFKSYANNEDMECMVFVPYRGKPVVIKNGEVVSTDNMTSFDVDWAYDRRTEVTVRGE